MKYKNLLKNNFPVNITFNLYLLFKKHRKVIQIDLYDLSYNHRIQLKKQLIIFCQDHKLFYILRTDKWKSMVIWKKENIYLNYLQQEQLYRDLTLDDFSKKYAKLLEPEFYLYPGNLDNIYKHKHLNQIQILIGDEVLLSMMIPKKEVNKILKPIYKCYEKYKLIASEVNLSTRLNMQ